MPLNKYTQQWRWILADMNTGAPITLLDRHARDRSIEFERNKGTVISGVISSDDPAANDLYMEGPRPGFPNLAEGDRLLYCLRRDYDNPQGKPWTPRAAGILLQYDDAATSEDGNTTFTAYDPWQYLYALPIVQERPAGNELLHNWDIIFDFDDWTIDEIVIYLLEQADLAYNGTWADDTGPRRCFLDYGWSPQYAGTIETVVGPSGTPTPGLTLQKGMSIGEAFDQLIAIGNCDIVMTPIYDPINRGGILCELSVLNAMGSQKPLEFAWDYSPWSVSEISRLVDGTGRANKINLHTTQGGDSIGIITELASVNRFGEYWLEQWFMTPDHSESLAQWAQTLKDTISEHPRTVSISPLPERSPEVFVDWYLGDEVEVLASSNLRATMSGFQRIQAFTLNISDEALETVEDMRVYIPSGVDTQ